MMVKNLFFYLFIYFSWYRPINTILNYIAHTTQEQVIIIIIANIRLHSKLQKNKTSNFNSKLSVYINFNQFFVLLFFFLPKCYHLAQIEKNE